MNINIKDSMDSGMKTLDVLDKNKDMMHKTFLPGAGSFNKISKLQQIKSFRQSQQIKTSMLETNTVRKSLDNSTDI
jgi:hypothetical protein